LQLFWNDQLVYGRVGVTGKVATPNGTDAAMGDIEKIGFHRHGAKMDLMVKTGPIPFSLFGRATAEVDYCLEVDTVVQKPDRENPPACDTSNFAQRVTVRQWQQVNAERDEHDWTAESMVVEYALHLVLPGFSTGGGTCASICIGDSPFATMVM
jgi:hypothetical protein